MKNLKAIMEKMDLRDKLCEISQLYGKLETAEDGRVFMGINYRFDSDRFMDDNIGSLLGVSGAKALIEIQKKHLEKSKHKIPLIFMHDIIHGYKTIFPSPLALSCSWQPELARKSSRIAAKESAVSGLHLTFAPMADLAVDARWGRVVETSGEDVYLNSLFSRAYVEGFQGNDVKDSFSIASCVKHFAAYGLAIAGKEYNTTEASEYNLRENHFPSYKSALDAGAKMVMTSFNALNGVPASGNKWLLQDILRKEMGFAGVVISDCTAIVEMINHGYCEDSAGACQKALEAGVDIEMVSITYFKEAEKLIEDGRLDSKLIDNAVMNVLKLKEELGLFENPFKDADEELEREVVLCKEHRDYARETARESIVLLKNDGVLPLSKGTQKVAVIGPVANSRQMLDVWFAYGEEKDCATLYEAIQNDYGVRYAKGVGILTENKKEIGEALELAKSSDIIILALGEAPLMSGESGSRSNINLPGFQEKFADEIFALGKKVIVVLYNGRPLAIPALNEKANAIIEAWLPGTEGNNALRDIIVGDYSPSARLATSFPYNVGQCPICYNRYNTGRPPKNEMKPARFSAGYVDCGVTPLFPFGYGLTYTTFEYSGLKISADKMTRTDTLTVSCMITNMGTREGIEVAQLYIRDMAGSLIRPIRMLKGFERVSLKPNESRLVTFEIDNEMLKFNTMDNGYCSENGKFRVFIAENAHDTNFVEFTLV